jgi:hypothetical protein
VRKQPSHCRWRNVELRRHYRRGSHMHGHAACRQTALRLPQCAGQTAAGAHQQLVHAMQVRHACAGSDCRQTLRARTLGWAEFWCLAASSHMLPTRRWRKLCNTCWWPMTLPGIVNAATGLICLTAGRLRLVLTCWRVCTGPAISALASACTWGWAVHFVKCWMARRFSHCPLCTISPECLCYVMAAVAGTEIYYGCSPGASG